MTNYKPTIGMEVHCELKTNCKMFSDSINSFDEVANTNINAIDFAYPGTLPKLNKKGVEYALMAALALNCKINKEMHFDRKNYFYPDLPKGYQITQGKTPIGYDGYIEINIDEKIKRIGIERIHIEEDTCKSIHENNSTYLNFNRAGVPLIEIVTKPDLETEKEVYLYLTKLREILLYLGVSDVKMEEGSMRCEVNISLSKTDILGTKVEIKNIGSISAASKAVLYEIDRQSKLLDNNESISAETRKYDEATNTTILMRTKEVGNEYRYFPEPDIPYIHLTDEYIDEIRKNMPVLPEQLLTIYKELGVSDINSNIIINNIELSNYFNNLIKLDLDYVITSNLLTGDILSYINKNNIKIKNIKMTNDNLKKLVDKLSNKEISSKIAKEVLPIMLETNQDIDDIIKEKGLVQISDTSMLEGIVNKLLDEHPDSIQDFKDGKDKAVKFLMGMIMKETKGSANPSLVNEILVNELKKR